MEFLDYVSDLPGVMYFERGRAVKKTNSFKNEIMELLCGAHTRENE